MIKTELIEDAHDYAPEIVAVSSGKGNRLDEQDQCLFVVTRVECLESPAEIRHPT